MDIREQVKLDCIDRQGGLCVICGQNLMDFVDCHEAIIKRGDLPKKKQKPIWNVLNCVATHHGAPCHSNTKENDRICIAYLTKHYGREAIQDWIASLDLRTLPGRAGEVMYDISPDP